jgi:hypothetical protein
MAARSPTAKSPSFTNEFDPPPAGERTRINSKITTHTITRRRVQILENNGYKDEIFTKRVRAGKRTYFFDVKSTKSEKDFYITITESKRVGDDEYEKHKIFLYKEDFEKFREALDETVIHVQTQLLEHAEPQKQA